MEKNSKHSSNEINKKKKKKSTFSQKIKVWLQANSGLNARFCCTWFEDVEKKYAKIHMENYR